MWEQHWKYFCCKNRILGHYKLHFHQPETVHNSPGQRTNMAALNMCFRATRLNKPLCTLIKDMSGFKYDFVCSATLRTLREQQILGRGVSSLAKGCAVFEVCPRSSHLRAVKHRHVNIENLYRGHVCGISVFCTNVRQYSAESSQGTRLTEEILKSRTASNEQDQEKNQNKTDESGEKKKESWFSGKNAWKLGLLSLAGMGFVMIGNLLFMWGKLLVYRRVNPGLYSMRTYVSARSVATP